MESGARTMFQYGPVLARFIGGSLALLLACTACTFQGVSDLKLVSAELVSVKRESVSSDYEEFKWDGDGTPPVQRLKVRFSTKIDLDSPVHNVFVKASFCNLQNGVKIHVTGFGVYYPNGERVGTHSKVNRDKNKPTIYHAYLYLHDKEVVHAPDASPAFDLRATPEDICFQVRGGNMFGTAFYSNTMVIPKEAVAEAFERVKRE